MNVCINNFVPHTHVMYRHIYRTPMPGVSYYRNPLTSTSIRYGLYSRFRGFETNVLKKPQMDRVFGKHQLIHSLGTLVKTNSNWVAHFEHYFNFSNDTDYRQLMNPRFRRAVRDIVTKPNCKNILPITHEAGRRIFNYIDDNRMKGKFCTIEPAVPAPVLGKKEKHDKIRLLFVEDGHNFYKKGGRELLASFELLDKKYDVELIFKSKVPEPYYKKYKKFSNITFVQETIPYPDLLNLYRQSDIFVFPVYQASFGVYLEAKSMALPVVTNDVFDVSEIVKDGETGVIVEPYISLHDRGFMTKWKTYEEFERILMKTTSNSYVHRLAEATSSLIEDAPLRKRMGLHGRKEVVTGRFSIPSRNKRMKKVYDDATISSGRN